MPTKTATATPEPEPEPDRDNYGPPPLTPVRGKSPDAIAQVRNDKTGFYMFFTVLNRYAEEWARQTLSDDDERNWVGRSVLVSPRIGNEVVRLARAAGLKVFVRAER